MTYRVTDATGTDLSDWVVTSGMPVPSVEMPVINHRRFGNRAPAAPKSGRIASFTFTPVGATPAPTPTPARAATPPGRISSPASTPYRRGARVTLRLSCSDPAGVWSCSGPYTSPAGTRSVSSPTSVRLTRAGTHRLRVVAADRLGNRSSREIVLRVS